MLHNQETISDPKQKAAGPLASSAATQEVKKAVNCSSLLTSALQGSLLGQASILNSNSLNGYLKHKSSAAPNNIHFVAANAESKIDLPRELMIKRAMSMTQMPQHSAFRMTTFASAQQKVETNS